MKISDGELTLGKKLYVARNMMWEKKQPSLPALFLTTVILLYPLIFKAGAEVLVQVVPEGIESVNGSSETMGCTSPLDDSGGVTVCRSQSYLVDGCSPDIDTSTSDWASHLVTVRRNEGNTDIHHAHVLLTFGFETAVTLTGIEIDFFHCPDWGIGAPRIIVYVNPEYNLAFPTQGQGQGLLFLIHKEPSQSSCDSLLTFSITGELLSHDGFSFRTFHILVDLAHDPSIQWVYIGDVRLIGGPPTGPCLSLPPSPSPTITLPSPSSTSTTETGSVSSSTSSPSSVTDPPSSSSSQSITESTETISSTTSSISSSDSTTSTDKPHVNELSTKTRSSTTSTESPTTTMNKRDTTGLTVPLVITALVILLILLLLTILTTIIILRRSKGKQYQTNLEMKDIKQSQEVESDHQHNGDHQRHDTLDVNNPLYSCHNRTMTQPNSSAATGVYSEVTVDMVYSEVKKDTLTKTVATDGQEFTGMYNVVTPLTPVKPASEIIESAAYACIKVSTDQAYADPGELDRIPALKKFAQAKPQCSDGIKDNIVHSQIYTGIQAREVPAVPSKSSDLLEYLDTESALNAGVHSESINHLDFTRNRFQGGGEGEPRFLGPFIPESSALPESYQEPAEVTSENITEKMTLGTGQFGQVVLANTRDVSLKSMRLSKTDDKKSISVTVAVKKLQRNPSEAEIEAFGKEAQFMSQIKHPNVLRLLGVCHQHAAFIMMEYTERGDLNQFLQQFTEIMATSSSSESQISSSELVYMASQIASGMQYMAQLKFVHRDLSTRSCFVGANGSVKVGCVGVKTGVYQSSYYQIRGNRMMPIRWMATECFSGKFSEKSDVWAFGVTLWELFSLAKQLPYPHLSDEEVIHNAMKREYRQFPVKPVSCPQSMYEVMEICWAVDMRQRATFQKLNRMLQIIS